MPEHQYDAGRQTIGTLLSTTSPKIEVPDWQRSFAWETQQVESFWQDLTAFSDQYPDANIDNEEYFLGSIVLVTGGPKNLLLDGQQRLATSTILLSVLRDARTEYSGAAATRFQSKYISDFDDATGSATYMLTLNHYDRDFFRAEIQDPLPKDAQRPAPTLKSHSLVRRARLYFEERVQEVYANAPDPKTAFDWNLRVGKVLCDHMSVVAVTSRDEDNAASVFETLNDRGIGLSTPDLLRNLLLRRAADEDQRTRIVNAWQEILEIGDEANVDEFLRHYWVSKHGDVKSRKFYREIKTKILEADIDSLEFSLELAEAAPVYGDIVRARSDDPALQELLQGVKALGAKQLYPLLLSGFAVSNEGEFDDLRALTRAAIVMFVRYNVIGGRESTVMEAAVYGAASQLRESADFDAAIGVLRELAPALAEFKSRFASARIPRRATARYLLRELEHALRVTREVAVEGTDKVHVEHIYPQEPAETRWENHTAIVNRLGNLTLLAKSLNASIKNAGFDEKKEKGYSNSDLVLTRDLLAVDDWSSEAINTRQAALSEVAIRIWAFDGEELSERDGENEGESEPLPDDLPEIPLELDPVNSES